MMKKYAILNAVALAVVLVVNGLANALPINGVTTGELSDKYPNLFVPAGFTFSIWGLIYLLLIGFVVNGFLQKNDQDNKLYESISSLFLVNCLFNASWIFAWHYLQIELSVLIMLGILTTLILIYLRLAKSGQPTNARSKWLVYTPFSVYLGWISVATIANFTTLLVTFGFTGEGVNEVFWTQLMIGIAAILGMVMLILRRDVAYALVIIWALFGIYSKRASLATSADNTIAMTAIIAMVLTFAVLLWRLFRKK